MILSMTAYGVAQKVAPEWDVTIEIRSVNNRFLDLAVRVPAGYGELEEAIKKEITRRFTRGRIEIKLQITRFAGQAPGFVVDEALADAFIRLMNTLKERYEIEEPLSLRHLVGIPGLIRLGDSTQNPQEIWPIVSGCLEEAISSFWEMRKREGDFIAADLVVRLDTIEALLKEIETAAGDLPEIYRQRMTDRIQLLTSGTTALDPIRIAQEVALMAEKSDISEEIVRAASHLKQFRSFMSDPEPAGKRLNFLLQELNREANTIGSKADRTAISHRAVEMKSEIEKIREQIQNIE